jgi:hypothetical protein
MFFRFGDFARAKLVAATCFDAIKSGERTSTTRFVEDSEAQFQKWAKVLPGDWVRVWSGPYREGRYLGESVIVEVTDPPQRVDLASLSPEQRESWSLAEGWSVSKIDSWILLGHPTRGLQVRYRLVAGVQ